MSPTTLDGVLRHAVATWPDSVIAFPDERTTLRELDTEVDDMARLIRAAGAEVGDHVGVLLAPGMQMVAALLGVARAGCVIVPINERLKSQELRYVVHHADLRVLLTTNETADYVDFPALLTEAFPELSAHRGDGRPAPQDAPELAQIVLFGDHPPAPGFTPAATARAAAERLGELPPAQRGPDDLLYIMYTSGTSAAPKGCMITNRAVVLQGRALADERYFLTPQDSFWCPLPLFHNGGLATFTACLSSGANYIHAGRFDPGRSLRQLAEEPCTHAIPAFETIWLPVLDHPDFPKTDLSALRIVLNAGTEERLRQFQARLPDAAQLANYGSTECSGHMSMTLPSDPLEIALTTGGHPLPGMQARVVDPETGEDRPAGEVGEILVRGDMRFVGYYKDPEHTASVIDADDWFSTGDLGRLDAEGRLTYTGRLKDMLKVGGENVAATEVEAFLLTHAAINIAIVVGAPDARYTEVPVAFVELAPGASATEDEIIEFCLGRIATFKVPRYVRFVDEWPMSGTKVKKYELRQRIVDELRERGITEAPRLSSSAAQTASGTAG